MLIYSTGLITRGTIKNLKITFTVKEYLIETHKKTALLKPRKLSDTKWNYF